MRNISLLLLLPLILLPAGSAYAQDDDNTISVNASASVEIPADRIAFNINLNAEADTPQKAYDQHQKREEVLLELLNKHQIEEEHINVQPIAIARHNTRNEDQETRIRTRQQIRLTLSDFEQYEEIQIALIESGYDEFNGQFMSSESDSGQDDALRKAIKTAREKAELIAQESDVQITSIKSINFSYNDDPPRPVQSVAAYRSQSDSSLITEYGQTISVSARVSVHYYFTQPD